MLAAWSDGVGSCIASMHRQDDARRVLGVPDEFEIQQVISFGYPAAHANPATRVPRPGGRKPLDQMVFYERWGARGERGEKDTEDSSR